MSSWTTGNRAMLANCPLAYHPVADGSVVEPCREMVFAGPRLDAIRDRRRLVDAC